LSSLTTSPAADEAEASTLPEGRPRSVVTEAEAVAAAEPVPGQRARHTDVTEIPYTRLGFRIFAAILILTALMMFVLIVFAVITYPSAEDAHAILGATTPGPAALSDWQDMQTQWFDQVTRLAQFLVFGSVLPLLATVVGYLLGERRSS
jgi:hypothetical protein